MKRASAEGFDAVVVDTAGRLQIDTVLMQELSAVRKAAAPDEVLLVLDAMTGQDAVNVASGFLEQTEITGLVFSKLDGDARGGAAISAREVTGAPIKLAGVGEGIDDLLPAIVDSLDAGSVALDLLVPYDRGDLVAALYDAGEVIGEKHENGGTLLTVRLPRDMAARYTAFEIPDERTG